MRRIFVAILSLFIAVVAVRAENNCTGATYYDADSDTCIACPAGYDYNTDPGKTSVTQCQIHCDAGTWNGEYTRLEYIESTGTQWIDTGIANWNNTIEYELTLSIQRQDGGTHTYFGVYDQWNSGGHSLPGISTYTNYRAVTGFVAGWGSGGGTDIGIREGQIGTIALKGNTYSWSEGSGVVFDRGAQFSVSASPVLFAVRAGGRVVEGAKYKLYGGKFWIGGALVRDFFPVRRNSDGVIGMYDNVTKRFFTNAGTGTFIAGADVRGISGECMNVGAGYWASASTVNYGSVGTRTACPAGTSTNGADNASVCTPCAGATYSDTVASTSCIACPAGYDYNTNPGKTSVTQCQIHCDVGAYVENEYTQLEYIESTGTQWIDTGQHFMYGDEFYFEYMPVATYSLEDKGYGAGTPLTNEITGGGRRINGNVTMYMRQQNYTYIPNLAYSSTLGKKYVEHWKISIEDGLLYSLLADFDGNTYDVSGAVFPKDYISGRTVALFSDNTDYTYPSHSRIYRTWLKRGDGTMAFDMVPARRNSDNVVGLYDTVTGTFFTNAGTGAFIAGADVGVISGECMNVGAGYWAAASTVNFGSAGTRNACPVGTSTNGATNASVCTPCADATYSDETAASMCKSCPAGYDYNTDPGKTDITQCQIHCDAGTWNGEYTQLEYIESTGTQWIDTGQHFMYGDEFYFEYMPVATYSLEDKGYGAGTPLTNEITGGGRRNNNDVVTMYMKGNNYAYVPTLSYNSTIGKKYIEHWNIDTATGQLISTLTDSFGYTYTVDGAIFANNYISGQTITLYRDNGSYEYPSRMRIYRTWLKRGDGTMAFDMVPVRRNSDGVIGMYDTVTRTFFTNAGTGEFIAGADVGVIGGECMNVGAGYWAAASTVNFGSAGTRNACPVGTTTVGYGHGADSANDCGRVLHIGDHVVYTRRNKETPHALHARFGDSNEMFYISLSSTNHNMSRLHLSVDGNQYTVYDDSLFYGERDFDTNQPVSQ